MSKHRVLIIGLDGYEQSVGDDLMQSGELPALARLKEQSSRWLLDHGPATRTGLAWEHFCTGLSPLDANRHSAVYFDSEKYHVWQQGTSLAPFINSFKGNTVVFDAPYFKLGSASHIHGVVNWGAHDPGVKTVGQPSELLDEISEKFGEYPAKDWIYGITWQSREKTREMCDALLEGINKREQISLWLLTERFPDWDLGLVVIGEIHSATEGFWHGYDSQHPLHDHPSAPVAGEGLKAVYRATDRFVDSLMQTFPDVTLVTFSMGGMGENNSDVPCMVLLPELLYRFNFDKELMLRRPDWEMTKTAMPALKDDEDWHHAILNQIPSLNGDEKKPDPGMMQKIFRYFARNNIKPPDNALVMNMDWMPVMRYSFAWPEMKAFALPSFYDGRIRINLSGREKKGKVPFENYHSICDQLEQMLSECRDFNGEPVVDFIERYKGDPLAIHPSDADIVIVWKGSPLAFFHPALGKVGPVPFRRTGGHTGLYGIAYISGQGITPGQKEVRSSFDVAPTILQLLGIKHTGRLSGKSLFQ